MFELLFVGQPQHAQLATVWRFLESSAANSGQLALHRVAHTSQALAAWDGTRPLHQIVLAPAYRDQFTDTALRQLATRYPLARITMLVSDWLEGETRSGRALPGVERLYVDQFIPRWQAIHAAQTNRWVTPPCPTQTVEESWMDQASHAWPRLSGWVAVCSELATTRDYLCDLCAQAGLHVTKLSPDDAACSPDIQAVIYEAVAGRQRQSIHLRQLKQRYPLAELTVLANFPRWHEIQQWRSAGAVHVLGKPFVVQDLLTCLVSSCGQQDAVSECDCRISSPCVRIGDP